SHYHPFAVWFFPEIVSMPGLPELEPAALRRPPNDRRLEYLDGARWSSLHAQSTSKAGAPCFGSKAAIAGLNQRGVSQALTERRRPRSRARVQGAATAKRVSNEPVLPAPVVFLCSRPGRKIAMMESSPQLPSSPCREFEEAPSPPARGFFLAVIK